MMGAGLEATGVLPPKCGSSRCRTRGQIINWVGRQNFPSMVCNSFSLGLL